MKTCRREPELEEILSGEGDLREVRFPVFKCNIGDARFQLLLEKLRYNQEHVSEIEQKNKSRRLREIASIPFKIARRKELAAHTRFSEIITPHLGLDYGEWMHFQLEKAGKYAPQNLNDLPFQLADPHVHAYDLIKETLKSAITPVAIVRFDTHSDRKDSLESETHRANYFSQIVFNNSLAKKISRVVSAGGNARGTESYTVNGIQFVTCGIFYVPEIDEPAIIDIDLDGCENGGVWGEFNTCRLGGHIYKHTSFAYYNQDNIKIHPRAAARVLRAQVKNPLNVAVALERGFRNRMFWGRVERDFIEELVA